MLISVRCRPVWIKPSPSRCLIQVYERLKGELRYELRYHSVLPAPVSSGTRPVWRCPSGWSLSSTGTPGGNCGHTASSDDGSSLWEGGRKRSRHQRPNHHTYCFLPHLVLPSHCVGVQPMSYHVVIWSWKSCHLQSFCDVDTLLFIDQTHCTKITNQRLGWDRQISTWFMVCSRQYLD